MYISVKIRKIYELAIIRLISHKTQFKHLNILNFIICTADTINPLALEVDIQTVAYHLLKCEYFTNQNR